MPGSPSGVEYIYGDAFGDMWMGSSERLWRYRDSHFTPVSIPPGLDKSPHVIQTMTMDADHGLWVSYLHDGIYRLKDRQWQHSGGIHELSDDPAISMLTDSGGKLWFGYSQNTVAVIASHHQTLYGDKQGLGIGVASTIAEIDDRIWIGGTAGLQFEDRGRFRFLNVDGQVALRGVSGIAKDKNGDLWLNTANGVFQVPGREVAQALADPEYHVHTIHFDYLDGLTGNPEQLHHLPTVLSGNDGRLYFAIQGSVVWHDPEKPSKNLLPPPVWIRSVAADGTVYSDPATITVPIRTRSLVIDYTATSILIPQRVQFRYKLDGIDTDWQEAGTRREALYSRLPPGRYWFHVIASNNDGIWNETGSSFEFTIPPAFTQSSSFLVLCGVAVVGLLWLVYWVRLHQVTQKVRSHLYTRISERERIARDLHDTFLQGVQGLLLSFHTATKHMKGDERSQMLLEAAFRQSDQVMHEGRELVLNLRGEAGEVDDLSRALGVVGQQFSKDHASAFALTVTGHTYPLHAIMRDEIYRIAREALANAFRHASAGKIEVDLVYGESHLIVRIRDNGVGIDPTIVTAGFREKHWGLPGMRERASSLGAELDLWSQLRAGTEVELRVPIQLASSIARANRLSSVFPPLLKDRGERNG